MVQATRESWWTCACLIFVLLRADWALAASNRTIDDADPQVTYFPSDQWSQGSTCSGCLVKLDPSQTFDGTWHDTSHHTTDSQPRFMQVKFTGTAVYVFNVLANANLDTSTTTSLQFTLDGTEDGTFLHTPSGSPNPVFSAVVYSRDGLDNTEHTLKMQATDTPDSVILFDFILFTVPEQGEGNINSAPAPVTTTITSISQDDTTTTITSTTTSVMSMTSSSSSDTTSSRQSTGSTSGSTSSFSSTSTTVLASTKLPSPFIIPSSSTSSLFTGGVTSSLTPSDASAPSSTARSSTKPTGLIVGATIGGIGLLAFIAALVLVLRKRTPNLPTSFDVGAEKGDDGGFHTGNARDGSDSEHHLNPIPESGSSVLLIGNPEHPPSSSSGRPSRFTSWVSSTSSYSSAPSSPMRVPSISNLPVYFAPTEVRESAIASSQLLSPSRPPSQKSPTSPPTNYARALPPLPHERDVSPTTPGTTTTLGSWDRTASTGNSSIFAQLAALQEEVDRLRFAQDAPPHYDHA
ncbi:hypothetical protein L226DRAFT_40164 [Lentinus tigrinus ALCF2SS1-7]|uniref:Uncharacterized protein n=1 Tax=Lentinus tigrinus ALCF2SS1-6 TaxID=1328759 RepID=A0A5C2STE4_9APHY|nr:hypothetical protein L227DRAFT_571077 [Lentinus tigrinus ALCF2SS1-6]RPD82895.1 hypothetical protein L226DRAFT_40164 [Lentinus tigrinus ALCF2SS1-7]